MKINTEGLPGPKHFAFGAMNSGTRYYSSRRPSKALTPKQLVKEVRAGAREFYWVPAEEGYTLGVFKLRGTPDEDHLSRWPYIFTNYWDAFAFMAALKKKIDEGGV